MPDYQVQVPRGWTWQQPAKVDYWHDGDSCFVWARDHPEEEQDSLEVRVDFIDALELHDAFGIEALAAAQRICPPGTQVILVERKAEKYGRRLARIVLPDGSDFGTLMLLERASDGVSPLAFPYNP